MKLKRVEPGLYQIGTTAWHIRRESYGNNHGWELAELQKDGTWLIEGWLHKKLAQAKTHWERYIFKRVAK